MIKVRYGVSSIYSVSAHYFVPQIKVLKSDFKDIKSAEKFREDYVKDNTVNPQHIQVFQYDSN